MSQINLFSYIKRYILTNNAEIAPNWNTPMTHTDFNVYIGTPAIVEFAVKNQDRKPVNLIGSRCTFTATDVRTRQAYLQKTMQVFDDYSGILRLNLSATEASALPIGFLGYSITQVRADGSETILYHDRDGRGYGYFEVGAGVMPGVSSNPPVPPGSFTPSGGYYISSSFPGSMQTGNVTGLHTVAIYMTNWTGKFWVEATLESDPAAPDQDWFQIQLGDDEDYVSFVDCCCIQAYSFCANTQWVRFKYQNDSNNAGTFDGVMYKF